MIFLMPAFLIFAAYWTGNLVKKVLHDSEKQLPEAVLIGTLLLFLLWELLVLPAIKLLASFSMVTRIYSGILLVLMIVAIVVCGKELQELWGKVRHVKPWMAWMVILLFFLQMTCFFILEPDLTGDFTVETINTTLQSDLIYENHPGMGDTFVYGITFRGKLVSLPLFYAYLTRLFSAHASQLAFCVVPIWVLFLSYMAYGLWTEIFFGKSQNKDIKVSLFFIGLAVLNLCASFSEDSIFYYQMYRGFRGETIVFSVLIPYTIYLCWQIYGNKKFISIIYLIMTGVTTLVLTDYQKGLVPFLLVVAITTLIAFGYKVGRWLQCRK